MKRSFEAGDGLLDADTLEGWLQDIVAPTPVPSEPPPDFSNSSNPSGGRSQLAFIEGYLAGQAAAGGFPSDPNVGGPPLKPPAQAASCALPSSPPQELPGQMWLPGPEDQSAVEEVTSTQASNLAVRHGPGP